MTGMKKGARRRPGWSLFRRGPPAWPSVESTRRPWSEEIHADILMFVYKGDENPVDVEFFLHHSPDERRVGILANTMLAIIVGFNVQGHRATSPLNRILGASDLPTERFRILYRPTMQKAIAKPSALLGFPTAFMLTRSWTLSKTGNPALALNYISKGNDLSAFCTRENEYCKKT